MYVSRIYCDVVSCEVINQPIRKAGESPAISPPGGNPTPTPARRQPRQTMALGLDQQTESFLWLLRQERLLSFPTSCGSRSLGAGRQLRLRPKQGIREPTDRKTFGRHAENQRTNPAGFLSCRHRKCERCPRAIWPWPASQRFFKLLYHCP